MKRFACFALALVLACGALSHVARASVYPAIRVGPNVHVSALRPNDDHFEVMIDADPANPARLIACSHTLNIGPTYTHTVTYVSSDSGISWHPVLSVGSDAESSGDPVCGFGFNGGIYALSIVENQKYTAGHILVDRSPDFGASWSSTTIGFIDREFITFDRTNGKYRGRVYVHGTGYYGMLDDASTAVTTAAVYRSMDGGKTFRGPAQLATPPNHWLIGASSGVVLSDGTFAFVFPEEEQANAPSPPEPHAWLKFVATHDGGEHFAPATLVTEYQFCSGGSLSGGRFHPAFAVDASSGPFRDRLYVALPEEVDGRCQIAVLHSSDKGKTWSPATIVDRDLRPNPNGEGPNSTLPAIAVNRDGVIAVTWHDRRDDPKNLSRTMRFAASVDGGLTFTPDVPLSSAANVPTISEPLAPPRPQVTTLSDGTIDADVPPTLEDIEGGDTAGLAADANGVFHALWPDNRTGVGQLWTAAIDVDGRAERNGDAALERYSDVTEKVSADFTNVRYDAVAATLSMDASLTNTSTAPLRAPLKVRLIGLDSGWGDVVSVTTENEQSGVGALWTLPAIGSSQMLQPKAKTHAKRVVFQLRNVQPISNALLEKRGNGLVHLHIRVFSPL